MTAIFRNIITRTRHSSSLLRFGAGPGLTRSYLSQAYQCLEAWNNRHNEDLVKLVGKPNEFFIILDQKYKKEFRMWPADVDLYLASLCSDGSNWAPEELEDLLSKLGSTGDRFSMLDSTAHTLFRLLVRNNHTDSLFRLLTQPLTYGLFLDHHVANLIMDHYLDQQDYTHAARVAAQLMLVEDFGRPLTQLFVLCSCLKWAHNTDTNKEWIDYTPVEQEPEDDVKIRCDYYPNPFFDDHFHLKDGNLLVGKTLAWCASRCLQPGQIRTNCVLLGWAMYQKWDKLTDVIVRMQSGQETGAAAPLTVSLMREHIDEHCSDEILKKTMLEAVDGLKVDAEYNLLTAVEGTLQKQVAFEEKTEVEALELMYQKFAEKRLSTMEELEVVANKKRLLREIAEKKEYLKKKEELLYYYDNEGKLDLLIEDRRTTKHPFQDKKPKATKRNIVEQDGDYIPPYLRKSHA